MASKSDQLVEISRRFRNRDYSAIADADEICWQLFEEGSFNGDDLFAYVVNRHQQENRLASADEGGRPRGLTENLLHSWVCVKNPGAVSPHDCPQREVESTIADGILLIARMVQNSRSESVAEIPSAHRSRAITKKKAASLLRGGNPDSAVEWLNQCIDDGAISCITLSRQSHVFDIQQFPESVREQLRGNSR